MRRLEIHHGFDAPAAHLQAATAAGKIALEASRLGLDIGAVRLLDSGTPFVSVTCDLIDTMRAADLTVDGLRRYASILAAGGQHDTVLKTIECRYAELLMPRQETSREREAAMVLARLWIESIQAEVGARYVADISYKPLVVGLALLEMESLGTAPQK